MDTHMSLDGKIVGAYLPTDTGMASQRQYYNLVLGPDRYFRNHKGWQSGRISSEDNFTHYRKPELDESAAPVPEGDFITVDDAPMHCFSVDPSGVLAWEKNSITYFDATAHVVEILSGKASNAYRDFLRRKGVSYIIAGKDGARGAGGVVATGNLAGAAADRRATIGRTDPDHRIRASRRPTVGFAGCVPRFASCRATRPGSL